ncbi:peptidase S1 and S6 chymotrypsin/Hap [Calothrix sp. NIES-4101]|nr:peptidase S1 and S6 chymotrypsin/Hap [Calothrix sp. NIES-4101]
MDWRKILLVAIISSLSISSAIPASHQTVVVERSLNKLSQQQVQKLAAAITVKILSGGFLGSGILVHQDGHVYTVLTNAHVLRSSKPPYRIQTPDGQVYAASFPVEKLHVNSLPEDADLALLEFRSSKRKYQVAFLGSSSNLNIGNEVFAAGFPVDTQGFVDRGFSLKVGEISLVLDKALEGGYRIGYTNDIQKGMSGGPLLNRAGEVVAINGMHAEPLWGNPYVYQDGTEPDRDLRLEMERYSWGIPMEIYVHQRKGKG